MLRKDMNDPGIRAQIDRNHELAGVLDIAGTPAYVVGDRIIPGAIDSESLAAVLAAERQKRAKTVPDSTTAPISK